MTAQHPRYPSYKKTGLDWLPQVPEHWEVKRLKYIASPVLGKMLTSNEEKGYSLKPYLRAQNINWLVTNMGDVKEMYFSGDELKKLRLQKDDLLVSEGGEVGRTAIWKEELKECYIQNSVHKISFSPAYHSRYYLYLFLPTVKSVILMQS